MGKKVFQIPYDITRFAIKVTGKAGEDRTQEGETGGWERPAERLL